MKKLVMAIFLGLLLSAMPAFAGMDHGSHDHGNAVQVTAGTSTESGIKATLKVNQSSSMVDLYLAEEKTGAPVTSGKVFAKIKLPNGKIVEKELMGMKMGQEYSFMNSLDLSLKGKYSFDITVVAGSTRARFDFMYTAK